MSTAAGDSVHMTSGTEFSAPAGDVTLCIELAGLKGGHSGIEIDKGRLNGVVGMASLLKHLEEAGIPFELALFEGGTAGNAIPPKAKAVIVVDADTVGKVEQEVTTWLDETKQRYEGIEDAMRCTVTEEKGLPKVVSAQDRDVLIRLATEVPVGVHTMSADKEGMVESSPNLGILKLDEGGLDALLTVRSSVAEKETGTVDLSKELAQELGLQTEVTKLADPWPYDPNSELTVLTKEAYQKLNGEDINVVAAHAGLECGTFKVKNPNLDMISIGPDLKDVHTPGEVLYLDSIPKTWRLLEEILREVG